MNAKFAVGVGSDVSTVIEYAKLIITILPVVIDGIPVLDAVMVKVPAERIRRDEKVYSPNEVTSVNEVVPAVFKLPVSGNRVIVTVYSPL